MRECVHVAACRKQAHNKKAGKIPAFLSKPVKADHVPSSFFAASSTSSPAFWTSLPAPAMVLQAVSHAAANIASIIRTIKRFMSSSFVDARKPSDGGQHP